MGRSNGVDGYGEMRHGLAHYRRDGWLGAVFHYVARVDSTNTRLLALGEQGATEGTVMVAEVQTAGRGRLDRRWEAPEGTCLLMSLLFRPPEPFAYSASRTTMLCGLAMVEAADAACAERAKISLKWPNDLIVERADGTWAKIAGMLSEVGLVMQHPTYLVVGMGVNVNVPREHVHALAPHATSLLAEVGHRLSRVALLDAFLSRAEEFYDRFRHGWDPLSAWQAHMAWMGKPVQVRTPAAVVSGVAAGINNVDGALVLELEDGTLRHFPIGDVSLRVA